MSFSTALSSSTVPFTVDWSEELRRFYMEVLPERVDDVDAILRRFSGLEEALWMSLTRRYGKPCEVKSSKPLRSTADHYSWRTRVIRVYAVHAPHKLSDVDKTLELMEKDGYAFVFSLLTKKHGAEPPPWEVLTLRQRLLVMFATYQKLERVPQIDHLVSVYEGMEDVLMRRIVNELGPEPSLETQIDPRDPRMRLRRILVVHDPQLLPRIEIILSRYSGKQLLLFATMQRRYGKEPTENEMLLVMSSTHKAPEKKETASPTVAKPASPATIVKMSTKVQSREEHDKNEREKRLMPQDPRRTNRDPSIHRVRGHVLYEDALSQKQLLEATQQVFMAYDRLLLPHVEALVAARYGRIGEAPEWLAFLDCCYCNAAPVASEVKLRTVVSLLDLKLGTAFNEAFAAGGVEQFLEAHPTTDARFLLALYGKVTEAELCTRNRLRGHYLCYNPGTPMREVDDILDAFAHNHANLHDALFEHYGPEPPPVKVDIERVQRILARNAPELLSQLDVVIEAHCMLGDTSDDVIAKITRTYGAEPSHLDDELDRKRSEECEGRFQIFVSELRMRDVLHRRLITSLGGNTALTEAMEALTEREVRVDASKLRTQHARQVAALEEQERKARIEVLEDKDIELKEVLDMFAELVEQWQENNNVECTELVKRHLTEDDALQIYAPLKKQLVTEAKELFIWLRERLLWRQKWRDEDQRAAAKRQEEDELNLLRQAEQLAATPKQTSEKPVIGNLDQLRDSLDELNEQAVKVLTFNAAVLQHRRTVRLRHALAPPQGHEEIAPMRPVHQHCVFSKRAFRVASPSRAPLPTEAKLSREDVLALGLDATGAQLTQLDWEYVFSTQMAEYVTQLLREHDPARVADAPAILVRYRGKEEKLVAALEQQYNVNLWRTTNLKARLEAFYDKVAPDRKGEIATVLQKFERQEEKMWEYLERKYGPPPMLVAEETRIYLKERLVKYLVKRAPHLVGTCDALILQSQGHADALFAPLVREYGPEDPDVALDDLTRKLSAFYRCRKMKAALKRVHVVARRFLGHERLLNEILQQRFGDSLVNYEPEVASQQNPQARPLPNPQSNSQPQPQTRQWIVHCDMHTTLSTA